MIQKIEHKNMIIIVGGGLAGLSCALHLRKAGFEVTLIEKTKDPHHKVCGEYISNEVLPYLQWLDVDPLTMKPALIKKLVVSSNTGKTIACDLPLGGFGLSRYELDNLLYQKALQNGCNLITDRVTDITFKDNNFEVSTDTHGILKSHIVIGAYGKRSAIDQKLSRPFISKKSPWLAVKAHYTGDFPDDLVALHNFKGGYCGVSKVEHNRINICYLADYNSFKAYKNIQDFQENVLCKNPHLRKIFDNSTALFEHPLTISQISFEKKEALHEHILMIGDTAGLIHPLCGNGMAMAIHSAKICAELIIAYLNNKIHSRVLLEQDYVKAWNKNFKTRLLMGRFLSEMIRKEKLFGPMQQLLVNFPSALPLIVKMTHGKPILC
ncbi:NAD(P)/FAD-dependent oxidoreductase [Pedobacter hiemivivus]|uniref:NAD(P)/FAD-dependent oxidoreductase n=1 Tax=Pedobacter hiemivivus TaxID=2530454 RepID=A0A4U1GDV1_9SPHI|nr:NAD(P)/FAD-dependent oxidoreductase [Pedobacter hiemivivus]TKC62217.1 NAD(P)/FAD-dependent oxidoreductase [Pedobacter hiemivivus]